MRYVRAGLRVVPINPSSKAQARKGGTRAHDTFCVDPEDFRPDELIAIYMGPCPLGLACENRWLMGFDVDGAWTRRELEASLGVPLPNTLTSKGERHLYYWLSATLPERDTITQTNDLFRTKKKQLGAADFRPCAGGYFLERGDWDGPFDVARIADLPVGAWARVLAQRKKNGQRTELPPCRIPLDFSGPCALPETARDALADQLAPLWPEPGAGGGHDLALAMGGILADAYITEDEAVSFMLRIWDRAGAPYQIQEVVTSMVQRRAPGRSRAVFGWPKLRQVLLEHNDERDVTRVLSNFSRRMPGLEPPKFLFARPKKETNGDQP
jgi:Bifunctional DNA primase/polymerase, N-terminal